MSQLSLLQLDSRQALAAHAAEWDRLWSESAATLPTLLAASLDRWLAAYAPHQEFRALVVTEGDRWLAALPFVGGRFKGFIPAGLATSNDWGLAFDLLLAETTAADIAPTADVLSLLARGLSELPWGFLSLHHALLEEPRWRHFRAACEQLHIASDWRPQLQIARANIASDWSAYRATWSKSHRRHIDKYERSLAALGPVTLEWHESLAPSLVQQGLTRGHALEERGWKGKQGASLQADAHAWTYLQAQAQELAAAGFLRTAFLRVGDRDAAFELGWISKGVYYSFKVAYDESFAHASPSHVLTARLLEKFHGERVQGSGYRVQDCGFVPPSHASSLTSQASPVTAFDFLCPLSPAVAHWRPTTYTVGRALLAPRGFAGPIVVGLSQRLTRRGQPSENVTTRTYDSVLAAQSKKHADTRCGKSDRQPREGI